MRPNSRSRERFELSLDGKQVASIVIGALLLLGVAFLFGLGVGRQVGQRLAAPAREENPLAALDGAPRTAAQPSEPVKGGAPAAAPRADEPKDSGPPKLSYHDALTKGRPDGPPIAEVHAAPSSRGAESAAVGTALNATEPAAPPPTPRQGAKGAPAPRPAARAGGPGGAKPAARVGIGGPVQDPVAAAVAKVQGLPAGAAAGRFAVQIGATQSEPEARRLAKRWEAEGARVVAADVPGKGRLYRVKVGSFGARSEAESKLQELARAGVKGFVTDAR